MNMKNYVEAVGLTLPILMRETGLSRSTLLSKYDHPAKRAEFDALVEGAAHKHIRAVQQALPRMRDLYDTLREFGEGVEIPVTCPHCGDEFNVADFGLRCWSCGEVLTVKALKEARNV